MLNLSTQLHESGLDITKTCLCNNTDFFYPYNCMKKVHYKNNAQLIFYLFFFLYLHISIFHFIIFYLKHRIMYTLELTSTLKLCNGAKVQK